MNIFITGIAGCGKSTIANKLKEMGYVSYDIESIKGLFSANYKTNDTEDLESVKKIVWECDPIKLKKLLKKNSNSKLNFYSGMATNWRELHNLFDIKLLLVANIETTIKRLKNRKFPEEFGSTEAVRNHIIINKSQWEKEFLELGFYKIDSNVSVEKVADSIFSTLQQIILKNKLL